jgi:hypothetical protein
MKDNYSEMNVDMEQILFSKKYEDLSAEELNEIKDFVSSKEEFNIMKSTLMNVKTSFGAEEEIEPVDSAKQNLMKMFEQKHGKVVPMNKPRPFYLNPVFQIGIAALFVLGIIYFYPNGENETMTAMKEKDEVKTEDKEGKDAESPISEEASAPAEDKDDIGKEESATEVTEDILEENEIDATFKSKVTEEVSSEAKADVAKDFASKKTTNELAKGEASSDDKAYSTLETDVYRSSSKNEKEKVALEKETVLADGVANTTTLSTNSVVTGGIAAFDELAVSEKSVDKDSDKKSSSKMNRTNNAGGHYMQPGKPAADLKVGVSLKDQPALSEFLFTAL